MDLPSRWSTARLLAPQVALVVAAGRNIPWHPGGHRFTGKFCCAGSNQVGLARFVARDSSRPRATEEELNDLIEDALAGTGLRLHHVWDEPQANEAGRQNVLGAQSARR